MIVHNGFLFDRGPSQSRSTKYSLPLHVQGSLLVAGHALHVSVQVRLDVLPDLLLRIEQRVWFTCDMKYRQGEHQSNT